MELGPTFSTTAARVAYVPTGFDVSKCRLFKDSEDGGLYMALGAGVAGAAVWKNMTHLVGTIHLPLGACVLGSTGAPLATFTSEDQPSMGPQLTNSEGITLRWNNHGTPGTVGCSFVWPADVNLAVAATAYFDVSKSGATVGDATTITFAVYNHIVAALLDADTNYGGATGALVGNATAKTVTRLSRALALADLPAAVPATSTILFGPTAGTLGTDDLVMHGAFILYQKK